jgi:peptidoglycan/xylan/chitin deacetylase (PgdA/CDA1 family)
VQLVAAPRSLAGVGHLYRHAWRPRLSERWQALRAAPRTPRGLATALLGPDASRPPRELVAYALAGALFHTGLLGAGFRALRRLDRDGRLLVLAYHRVLPEELRMPGDTTSIGRRHFQEQVEVLARLLRHPPAAEALAELRRPVERRRPPAMLVTFDDGHASVRQHAWPALRRRGVPLVFCVTTGKCDADATLWCDEVTELLVYAPLPAIHLRFGAGPPEVHLLGDEGQRLQLADQLKRRMKALPAEEHARFLVALRAACGGSGFRVTARSELCDWESLELMRREGVTLAAHSHAHAVMSRLSPEGLAADVRSSAAELARHAGVGPRLFAYPNGLVDDISPAVVERVRAEGFSHAFTMSCGMAAPDDDPLLLPRVAPQDRPGVMVGLSLLRHLARAVARDAWRRWRGRPARPAAAPQPQPQPQPQPSPQSSSPRPPPQLAPPSQPVAA